MHTLLISFFLLVLGSRGDESVFIENPRMAMTCLAIPGINGLDLFHLNIKPQEVISVPDDWVVKAILYFPDLMSDNHSEILENLSNYSNGSPVVGGSIDKIMTANSKEKYVCVYIFIYI